MYQKTINLAKNSQFLVRLCEFPSFKQIRIYRLSKNYKTQISSIVLKFEDIDLDKWEYIAKNTYIKFQEYPQFLEIYERVIEIFENSP